MCRNIFNKFGLIITSFFGGTKRGRCLQFMIGHEWIECNEDDVREIADVIDTWLLDCVHKSKLESLARDDRK